MGHYYDINGRACHTVIGKNGNERATTLRDARERRLFKSVTTVMNVLDKPALTAWKIEQALITAWDDGMSWSQYQNQDEFLSAMRLATEQRLKEKPDLGTAIHAAIEAWARGETFAVEYEPYVYAARSALATLGVPLNVWRSEHAFCWPALGYAGTVDMHCDYMGRRIVLDWKSKGFTRCDSKGKERRAEDVTWPEMIMQLAAYGRGLFSGESHESYNVMLSTEEPGLWLLRKWTLEEQIWGLKAFEAAKELCFILDRYDPRREVA